jgi:hypothetical protein
MTEATANHTSKRRPRFTRTKDAPRFQLTERDLAVVRNVARYRFLRSTHISQLLDASNKKIVERLSLLYHAGYLDRPRSQLQYHVRGGGSAPLVYALGNLGAQLLRSRGGAESLDVDWTQKNRESGREFILHTLATADLSVALAAACRGHSGLELQEADALLQSVPSETRSLPRPWAWRVHLQHDGVSIEIGVIPDLVFALILPDGRRRAFFVEIDRGTMPLERLRLTQTSVLRKLLAYRATHAQQLHTKRFGWKTYRTLLVTAGPARASNMRTLVLCTDALRSSPLFLFAEHAAVSSDKVLTSIWVDAQGKGHSLI